MNLAVSDYAWNSIEALVLNEIAKEIMIQQKNPKSKILYSGHHYGQVQVSTHHDHCFRIQK